MSTAGQAMAGMNKVNDPVKMQQTMQDFARQNQQMDMASEMMDDAIDDAMDDDDVEDETNDVVNQLLDDIGIDLTGKMASAPKGRLGTAQVPFSFLPSLFLPSRSLSTSAVARCLVRQCSCPFFLLWRRALGAQIQTHDCWQQQSCLIVNQRSQRNWGHRDIR